MEAAGDGLPLSSPNVQLISEKAWESALALAALLPEYLPLPQPTS